MATNTLITQIEALTEEERTEFFTALRAQYSSLSIAELTAGIKSVGGDGVLDVITVAIRVQLKELVKELGMSNNQSALILGESLGGIVNAAVQFALTKDTAYYDAITARHRSEVAVQELAIAKVNLMIAQKKLDQETLQEEVLNAQVSDFKTDGTTPVTGQIGAQKKLLAEQVEAYRQRAANDFASLYLEAFAVIYSTQPSAAVNLLESFNKTQLDAALLKAKEALPAS